MSNTLKLFMTSLLLSGFLFAGCETKDEEKIIPERNLNPPPQQKQTQIIKKANIDPKIEEEILAVIRENLEAANSKDVDRVLATVHESSPQLNSTKEGMNYVFNNYNLDFILEQAEVIEVKSEDAKVYYVQFTKSKGGQAFADNRAAGFHFMKKSNGKWKIYKTEPVK